MFAETYSPGSKAYLHGEPVTILAIALSRAYWIAGHHSWSGCHVEDLREEAE